MAKSHLPSAILGWLQKGYPQGIPRTDQLPLLEVLHRKLTEAELDEIVELLVASDKIDITEADIKELAERRVHETPSKSDVARVAGKLAGGGWPLSGLKKVRKQAAN